MPRPVKLSVVRDERRLSEAKELRRDLYGNLASALQQAGQNVSGYAVVVWSKDGANYSAVRGGSPILTRMAPSFVKDALNQHVTINMVEDR